MRSLVVAATCAARLAHADDAPSCRDDGNGACESQATAPPKVDRTEREPPPEPVVSTPRRVGAVLFALGPGLLVRGGGSYLVGKKHTAKRLVETSTLGLGAMLVGGAPILITGGHPYSVATVPLVIAGGGVFLASWFADIATAAGAGGIVEAPRALPPWSLQLGTMWQRDPYRQRGLVSADARVELDRIGLGAGTLVDADNSARDFGGEVRVRIAGAEASGVAIREGSRVFARTSLRYHRDDDDHVTLWIGDLEVIGRLDLVHIDPALAGTFFEVSTGLAWDRAEYAGVHDDSSQLLGTFAWGLYLGGRGEATVFYNHRRDDLVGGLGWFHADGFVGYGGLTGDVLIAPHIAVRGELDYGNAVVTMLALRYQGERR